MQIAFPPILSVTILLTGILLSGCHSKSDLETDPQSTPAADSMGGRQIIALGCLQPRHGIISVSTLPGERLAQLNYQEGDLVPNPGVSLGELASHQLRTIELSGLQAQYDAAKKKLAAELAVSNARVQQAEAALAQATMRRQEASLKKEDLELLRQQAALAKTDLDTLHALAEEDTELATEAEIKRQTLAYRRLESECNKAQQSLNLAIQASDLAIEAAEADLAAAKALVHQVQTATSLEVLEQQIEAAVIQKSWATLPAPCGGTVLKTLVAPGEFISQTPILQLADLTQMACRAEVYEADIQWVSEGDPVRITSHAFRGQAATEGISGHVKRISHLIGLPDLRSLNPMDRSDRHVVEVLIEIDPANIEATTEAARLVGLQVTVRFKKKP